MTIISATQNATGATAANAAAGNNALEKLSGDYEMFLKLLTSQMTNQDPLNPMDTSQYTQQLVQFSQVEQSIQQNRTLQQILASLTGSDMVAASNLIGHDVSLDSDVAILSADAPARWEWTGTAQADSLNATVSDSSGKAVYSVTLDPDAVSWSWDGKLANGDQAPAGAYTLVLEARDAAGAQLVPAISSTGRVDAVSTGADGLLLAIGGVDYASSLLRGVR